MEQTSDQFGPSGFIQVFRLDVLFRQKKKIIISLPIKVSPQYIER